MIATLLTFRRENPELFAGGTYEPLRAEGPRADEVVGFQRRHGAGSDRDTRIVVAIRRFPGRHESPGRPSNADAALADVGPAGWRDLLTGRVFPLGVELEASALFDVLPAAVLVQERSDGD